MTKDSVVSLDEGVETAVLSVIREAKSSVTIVSPYLKLWTRAQQVIEQALARHVDITFYVRNQENQVESDSVAWLTNRSVKVYAVDLLHAKIYLNETTTLISSINMLDTSVEKSKEIAMRVRDPDDAQQIRDYVEKWIRPSAQLIPGGQVDSDFFGPKADKRRPRIGMGFCIRCGMGLVLDPSRPLCDVCYDSWAEWKNEDYPENVCHACGRQVPVTYGRPLCKGCYSALR